MTCWLQRDCLTSSIRVVFYVKPRFYFWSQRARGGRLGVRRLPRLRCPIQRKLDARFRQLMWPVFLRLHYSMAFCGLPLNACGDRSSSTSVQMEKIWRRNPSCEFFWAPFQWRVISDDSHFLLHVACKLEQTTQKITWARPCFMNSRWVVTYAPLCSSSSGSFPVNAPSVATMFWKSSLPRGFTARKLQIASGHMQPFLKAWSCCVFKKCIVGWWTKWRNWCSAHVLTQTRSQLPSQRRCSGLRTTTMTPKCFVCRSDNSATLLFWTSVCEEHSLAMCVPCWFKFSC